MNVGVKFHRGRWWKLKKTKSASSTPSNVLEIKLLSININGVHTVSKRNNLLAMQMHHNRGIMLLADTRVHDDREIPSLNRAWKCKEGFWSKGTPNVGGTAVLFYKLVIVQSSHHDAGSLFTS
jgi:exonuclease III